MCAFSILDELLRVLHRHKIERLNLQSLAFGRNSYRQVIMGGMLF